MEEYMQIGFWWEMDFLLRLFLAGICGAIIGYERTNRLKEAGIRTHLIVAMGSALFMIVSKYGFGDVTSIHGVALDPSRVAAQIVTGVGFLGAGMIFVRNQSISGLTTAAGIWATAGIGMAIGAGLYFVGILGAALIFILHMVLHKHFLWLRAPTTERLTLQIAEDGDGLELVHKALRSKGVHIVNFKARHTGEETILVEFCVKMPYGYNLVDLLELLKNNPQIRSMEL